MPKRIDRFRQAEARLWQRAGLAPEERRLRLRSGDTVRVQEVGTGDPVLFIHGASNAGTSWAGLVGRLARFRCIVLDRPGCGLSDPMTVGRLRDVAALEAYADTLVLDVLDALELRRAHVVATSYGGYFAFRGAAAHPERVDHIVELGWSVGAPTARTPLFMRLSAVPGMQALATSVPVTPASVRAMLRQVGLRRALESGAFSDEMMQWYVSLLRDTDTMKHEIRSSPKVITPIRGMNDRMLLDADLLSRVAMPVLFLWGDEDPNGGEDVARRFAAPLPHAELQMVGRAGHAPWIDEPDLCCSRMQAFLQD